MNSKEGIAQNKRTNYVFLLLLLGLLILRFPYFIALSFNKISIVKLFGIDIFDSGTYLLTAMLIILKRDSLLDYNIGFCSLLLFIIAPFTKLISEILIKKASIDVVQADSWVQILVSSCLLVGLLCYRPIIHKRKLKEIIFWLSIAVSVGVISGILMGNLSSLQEGERTPNHPTVSIFIRAFLTQVANAAVIEEPLFRGYLWGFLKSKNWKVYWIWLFQAVLFMLGHIYYLGIANYSFWIIVPISALIFGLLVWRSRSIGTSMIAHGLINAVSDIVAHYTW